MALLSRALGELLDAWSSRTAPDDREPLARALLSIGRGCLDDAARREVLDLALERARSFTDLTAIASVHAPAFEPALREVQSALDGRDRFRADRAIDALMLLVGAAPPDRRLELFATYARHDLAHEEGAHRVPARLGIAATSVGRVAPEIVLDAAARVHPFYRALAHARVTAHLEGEARAGAVRAALADEKDPSLADARPYVALAPHLDAESCERALTLASRLHCSPSFGATALAAVLPRWAAHGHAEDAASRARSITEDEERAVALLNVATTVGNDDWLLEAMPKLELCSCVGIALVAPGMVRLGHGALLLDLHGARWGVSLHAMAEAATGDERADYIERLAHVGEPEWLEPVVRELPAGVVAKRVAESLLRGSKAPAYEILEDETGYGPVQWLPLLAHVAGDDVAVSTARRLAR